MPEVRTKIPTTELKPGQFFLTQDRWYRATSTLIQHDGHAPQIKAVSPVNGDDGWMWLHATEVTTTEGNTIPATFRSATLARKAKAIREKAEELARTADRLEALSIEMDFVAREATNA